MFRVGETYTSPNGMSTLIIADNTDYHHGANQCPIIGVVTMKNGKYSTGIYGFNEKGWYCGIDPKTNSSYLSYVLQSDEPNEDELKLIANIRDAMENRATDDLALTKIIRQLRK